MVPTHKKLTSTGPRMHPDLGLLHNLRLKCSILMTAFVNSDIYDFNSGGDIRITEH